MTAPQWVVSLDELWPGEPRGFVVAGTPVLLLRLEETVYAYEDRCAHLGQRLSCGRLHHGVLTCPAHHWEYDMRSGEGVNPSHVRLRKLPVTIRAGDVWIELPESPAVDATTLVGPVLEAGDTAEAVAQAICQQNAAVEVQHHGSYLRVLCPPPCRVSRVAIEHALGRGFGLPGELEQIMPSFRGELRVDEDGAEWWLGAHP